eukprot:1868662-Prymnesium_polylepis.1
MVERFTLNNSWQQPGNLATWQPGNLETFWQPAGYFCWQPGNPGLKQVSLRELTNPAPTYPIPKLCERMSMT